MEHIDTYLINKDIHKELIQLANDVLSDTGITKAIAKSMIHRLSLNKELTPYTEEFTSAILKQVKSINLSLIELSEIDEVELIEVVGSNRLHAVVVFDRHSSCNNFMLSTLMPKELLEAVVMTINILVRTVKKTGISFK